MRTPFWERSSKSVPQPIRRDKKRFWEYGNDYDEQTGRWTIYVDIISGNPDLIDCVGFRFMSLSETYTVYRQFPTIPSDGTTVHRFLLFRTTIIHILYTIKELVSLLSKRVVD